MSFFNTHGQNVRHLARWGICLLLLSLFAQAQRPNIVLIFADDIGYEAVSPQNEEYCTPNLDRLSETGIRFDNAFSNALCTPSRVKIMTGMSNVRNYKSFGQMDRHQTTFANQLKRVGYATAMAGKWQLGGPVDQPQLFGFDQSLLWQQKRPRTREGTEHDSRYPNPQFERNGIDREFEELNFDSGEYGPDVLTDFLIDFIEDQAQQEKPFLAYYAMMLPHCPFAPTPASPDWDSADLGSTKYAGMGTNADLNRHFADMVSYIDQLVGHIESKLVELGIRENTLILFIGDNGTDTPITTDWNGRVIQGGKRSMNDNGLRVPFIANWPGTIAPGTASDRLIDFSDILPTFCELAGAPLPEGRTIDGYSLVPEMLGKPSSNRDYVYIYYLDQKVLARTADYMVLRDAGTSGGSLYHFPELFTRNLIKDANMTPEERALKADMVALLDEMITQKGSEKGPAQSR